MAGFDNDVMYAINGDFSTVGAGSGSASNGLQTNGQMWIGTTTPNVGGTNISVGTLTSPDSSVTVGYSTPNITLQVAGGTTTGKTITGDSGGALPPTAGNWNIVGGTVAAGTSPLKTAGSGSTLTINAQITQAIASTDATKIGLAAFSSANFSVDANGFVTITNPGAMPWTDEPTNFNAAKSNGYFVTGTAIATLPASPSQGDTIQFIVDTTNILTIQANTGQFIRVANNVSASAGTSVNTQRGDAMTLVYRTADTTWLGRSQGAWTTA